MPKRALIVIDVQNEYFDGALPISDPPPDLSLANIGRAMDAATQADVPVIVVRHGTTDAESPIFREGSHAWELHPEIERRPRDHLIDKTLPGLVHRDAARGHPRRRGRRHRRDHRLHDPHVRRHHLAPGGASRPGSRDHQRRHGHAAAREQRRRRGRRRAAIARRSSRRASSSPTSSAPTPGSAGSIPAPAPDSYPRPNSEREVGS